MTKKAEAKLRAELKSLRAESKVSKAPRRNKPATSSRTAGFVIDDREAMSEEYGVAYSYISFVDASGKGISEAPTADSDPLGFEAKQAIKDVRYGTNGRGKFRYDRKARAWSGQTASIPEIVLENGFS